MLSTPFLLVELIWWWHQAQPQSPGKAVLKITAGQTVSRGRECPTFCNVAPTLQKSNLICITGLRNVYICLRNNSPSRNYLKKKILNYLKKKKNLKHTIEKNLNVQLSDNGTIWCIHTLKYYEAIKSMSLKSFL